MPTAGKVDTAVLHRDEGEREPSRGRRIRMNRKATLIDDRRSDNEVPSENTPSGRAQKGK